MNTKTGPTNPINVLFVDDDSSLQLLASAMLNNKLFHVLAAQNTKEADVLLAQHSVDLIVCDVMMPNEDGISYCARLKERGNKIPFMILSAVGDPQSIQQGLAAGANQYLVKPFDVAELQKQMVAMTGRKLVRRPEIKAPTNTAKLLAWFRR